MAFASGPIVACFECHSANLRLERESFDDRDRIFVGEVHCLDCSCAMLYGRRGTEPLPSYFPEGAEMKKSKTKRSTKRQAKPAARRAARNVTGASRTHRITTHKPNGGLPASRDVAPETIPVGEAMRRAVEELGAVKIEDDLAPHQMLELAECFEDITRRRAAFNQKADEAKTAKKSLESATELLLEKVRSFTHPKALPLFDAAEREQDQDDMLGVAASIANGGETDAGI